MAERRELPLIACSLPAGEQGARLQQWRALVSRAVAVTWTDAGAMLTFEERDVVAARHLAALESRCCTFFTFDFETDVSQLRMSVGAPPGARELVQRLLSA